MDITEAVRWWNVHKIGLSFTGGRYNQSSDNSLGGCASIYPLLDTGDGLSSEDCIGTTVGNIPMSIKEYGGSLYHAFILRNGSTKDYTLKNIEIWVSKSSSAPGDEPFICTDSGGMLHGVAGTGFFVTMSSIPSVTSSPTVSSWYGYGATISIADNLEQWDAIGIWVRHSVSSGATPQTLCSFSIGIRADVS